MASTRGQIPAQRAPDPALSSAATQLFAFRSLHIFPVTACLILIMAAKQLGAMYFSILNTHPTHSAYNSSGYFLAGTDKCMLDGIVPRCTESLRTTKIPPIVGRVPPANSEAVPVKVNHRVEAMGPGEALTGRLDNYGGRWGFSFGRFPS